MKILITGARSPASFELAKAFKDSDYEVFSTDSINTPLYKKLGIKLYKHFAANGNFDKFCNNIKKIIINSKAELIIPVNEEIFYFVKAAKKLGVNIFAPDLNTLMMLHSKIKFNEFCISIGLDAPKTEILPEYKGNFENKILKREFSRFGEEILKKPKYIDIHNTIKNPYILQDFIEGRDLSFYAIAKDGAIKAFCAYSSKWRTKGGASYYFSPIKGKIFDNTKEIAKKIAEELKLTGQFSCDLRLDKEGKLWVIECNPRTTSGIHLLNPEDIVKAIILGEEVETINEAKYLLLPMLIYGLPSSKFADWKKAIKSGKDVLKNYNFQLFTSFLTYQYHAILNGLSLSRYLTHDIECNEALDET